MNGMIVTIILFLSITAGIGLSYGLATMISTYPGKFWIERVYFHPISDDDILFFSLIAAMYQVTELLIPMDKYIQIYTRAGRKMEYALLSMPAGVKNRYIEKKKAYKK